MGIFDTIRENLETAGMITADIAKRTAETLRLRDQIRRDKKEIRKLTYEIGQTYLRLHADDYEEVYKEFIEGIEAARMDIEKRLDELAKLKEMQEQVQAQADEAAAADDEEEEWDDFFDDVNVEMTDSAEPVAQLAESAVSGEALDAVEAAAPGAETDEVTAPDAAASEAEDAEVSDPA